MTSTTQQAPVSSTRPADWALRGVAAATPLALVATLFGQWVRGAPRDTALSVFDEPRFSDTYDGSGAVLLSLVLVFAVALPVGLVAAVNAFRSPERPRIGPSEASVADLAVAVVVGYTIWQLDQRAGLPLVAALATLLVGGLAWGALSARHRRPPTGRTWSLTAAVAATVVAVVAVGATTWYGGEWYAEGRHVDATTTDAPAPDEVELPTEPGAVAWTTERQDGPVRLVGRYAVVSNADGIQVRDAATGEERWHYRRDDLLQSPSQLVIRPTIIGADPNGDRIAVLLRTTVSQRVFGFDLRTGDVLWDRTIEGGIVPAAHGEPAVLPTVFLIRGEDGALRGHDLDTGERLWTADVPCEGPLKDVTWVNNAVAVVIMCSNELPGVDNQELFVTALFDDSDGHELWRAEAEVEGVRTTDVDPDPWLLTNGVTFLAMQATTSEGRFLTVYGTENGTELWTSDDPRQRWVSVARTSGGAVLLSTAGDTLSAVDMRSGEPRWEYPLNQDNPATLGAVTSSGGRVFAGLTRSDGTRIVVLEGTNGIVLGEAEIPADACDQCHIGLDLTFGPTLLIDPDAGGTVALRNGDWFHSAAE